MEWSAARPPTDTWQSTAGALRKQPPRDAQQAGVRGEGRASLKETLPLSRRVPIPHKCLCCCLLLQRRTLPRRPPASLAKFPTDTSLRMRLGWHRGGPDPGSEPRCSNFPCSAVQWLNLQGTKDQGAPAASGLLRPRLVRPQIWRRPNLRHCSGTVAFCFYLVIIVQSLTN